MLFYLAVPLPGQESLFRQMAADICQCMGQGDLAQPDQLAKECLRIVALRNAQELRETYGVIATEVRQRELMADRLSEELILNCPLLSTLRLEVEAEDKWSDGLQRATEQLPFTSPKRPPPDVPNQVTAEAPWEWRMTGTVKQTTPRGIRLVDETGNSLDFEVPLALKRQHKLQAGDQLSVRYRREWRKGQDEIVHIVLSIL